jgi:hypothetical protein
MMLPNFEGIPSEATIESLTNHHILLCLNEPKAWILTPTRREEKNFGYDGSLSGTKVAVIQYKRLARMRKGEWISVRISRPQHEVLRANFEGFQPPCAFYAFSNYQAYKDINDDYLKLGSPEFFRHTIFFDMCNLPIGVQTVRLYSDGKLRPARGNSQSIDYWTGPEFIEQFKADKLGLAWDSEQDAGLLLGASNTNRERSYNQKVCK